MEGLFYPPWSDREPFVRTPPPVERADGEENPGSWPLPPNLLPWQPELLEPVPWLGLVCAELTSPAFNWTHSFPVHTQLPASREPSNVPSIDYWFRESLGRRSPSTTAGSVQAQDDSRPFEDLNLLITNLDKRSGCQQGTSVCTYPAGS